VRIGLFISRVPWISDGLRLGRASASRWKRRLLVVIVVKIFLDLVGTAAITTMNARAVEVIAKVIVFGLMLIQRFRWSFVMFFLIVNCC
jgi:hypothetical protein